MTSQEILDANKKIAEFDGVTIGKDKVFMYYRNGSQWALQGLKYNSCWEWLMPVVEKICHQAYDDGDTPFLRTFGMVNSTTGEVMVRFNRCQVFSAKTLMEATYLAVVDFIS